MIAAARRALLTLGAICLAAAIPASASADAAPGERLSRPPAPAREEVLRALAAISSIPRPVSGTAGEVPFPVPAPVPAAPGAEAGAAAGEPEARRAREHATREEREEKAILVGARLALSVPFSREEGREETFVGGVLFFERSLVPGWIELELSAGFETTVNGESKYVAPFDVLLKHPFHVSPLVNPYLGLGASLHLERYDGRREVLFALPFVVGTYLWWNRTVGLDVEVGYKLIFHSHLSHELEFSVGPVLQF